MLAHPRLADAALRGIDRLWGGLHAHIMLRVRYADDALDGAIRDGIDQVVLLGTGFDTTSLRHGTTGCGFSRWTRRPPKPTSGW